MTELGEGIEDTRRRVTIDELVPEHTAPASVDELLAAARGRAPGHARRGSAEVAHEALIREWPRLRGWLDEDRAGIARAPRTGPRRAAVGRRRPRILRPLSRRAAGRRPRTAGRAQRDRARLPRSQRRRGRPRTAQADADEPPAARAAGRPPRAPVAIAGGVLSRVLARQRAGRAIRRRGASADVRRRARRCAGAQRADPGVVAAERRRRSHARGSRRDPRPPTHRPPAEPGRGPRSAAVERSDPRPSRPAPTAVCSRAATPPASCGSPTCGPGGRAGRRSSSRSGGRHAGDGVRARRPDAGRGHGHGEPLRGAPRRRRHAPSPPGRRVAGGRDRRRVFRKFSLAFAPDGRRLAVALATWEPKRSAPVAQRSCSSTPTPGARYGAPLSVPARADGGPRAVRARRCADHVGRGRARRSCGTRGPAGSCAVIRSVVAPRSRPTGARSRSPATARTSGRRAPPWPSSTCAAAGIGNRRPTCRTSGS